MEVLSDRKLENGDYEMEVSYSLEEYEHFKKFAEDKGKDVDKMKEDEIVQFSVIGILKEQIERMEDEQTGTSKTDKD